MACTNPMSSDNRRRPWLEYFGLSSVYCSVSQKSLLSFMEFKVIFQNLLPEWCLGNICAELMLGRWSWMPVLKDKIWTGRIWKVLGTILLLRLESLQIGVMMLYILSPSCASLYTGMMWGITGALGGSWPSPCVWFVHSCKSSTDARLLWCSFSAPFSSLCFLPESFWSGTYFFSIFFSYDMPLTQWSHLGLGIENRFLRCAAVPWETHTLWLLCEDWIQQLSDFVRLLQWNRETELLSEVDRQTDC